MRALINNGGREHLVAMLPAFAALETWTHDATEAVVRDYAEKIDAKLGQVAQPIRAALTGRTTSPGVFDVLTVLGKDEALARIKDVV